MGEIDSELSELSVSGAWTAILTQTKIELKKDGYELWDINIKTNMGHFENQQYNTKHIKTLENQHQIKSSTKHQEVNPTGNCSCRLSLSLGLHDATQQALCALDGEAVGPQALRATGGLVVHKPSVWAPV